jgi:hypothetical protein
MKALDQGYHLSVAFSMFGAFFTYMVVRDLHTGEIWRGGPVPTITLAKHAAEFYGMIVFFSVLALTFGGGTLWTLYFLLLDRPNESRVFGSSTFWG